MSKQVPIYEEDLEKILNSVLDLVMKGSLTAHKSRPDIKRLSLKACGYFTQVELDKSAVKVSIKEIYTLQPRISATYLRKSQQLVGLNAHLLGAYVKSLILLEQMADAPPKEV